MRPVTLSRRYRKFVTGRDQVLEKILHDIRLEQTDLLRRMASEIIRNVVFYATTTKFSVGDCERVIQAAKNAAYSPLYETVKKARLAAFILSAVSEAEALAQASGRKEFKYHVTKEELKNLEGQELSSGGRIGARVMLYLDRLGRRILDRVQIGMTMEETPAELADRVKFAMPQMKVVRGPQKTFRRLKEADDEPRNDMALGFVDDDIWQWIVDLYKQEYIQDRAPRTIVDTIAPRAGEDMLYAWELERDTTEDFVNAVKLGQVQAAETNGIKDFVWIAIIDDRTDECCLWRDGLLTSEIEDALGGEHKDDECQAITPPAHMNCRCRIAPALEGIDEDRPASNAKEFDEWLET